MRIKLQLVQIILILSVTASKTVIIDNVDYVEGNPINQKSAFIRSIQSRVINLETACDGKNVGGYCSDDCGTYYICAGEIRPSDAFKCAAYNDRDTPYCWNDKCQSEQDVKNPNCGSSFRCTSDGTFPEPTNCGRYRICRDKGAEGELRECPTGLIFDTNVKLCRERKVSNECPVFNCNRKFNEFVTYPSNLAYYAFCVTPPNRQVKYRVFKCRDDINFIFNTITKQCEYRCRGRGLYVDRQDCEGYISCRMERGKYVSEIIKCPSGHYFSEKQCIAYQSSNSPKCTPEIPPPPTPDGNQTPT